MVIKELCITLEDGVKLYRSYSDLNLTIQKDGTEEIYSEAVDREDSSFTYTETDIPIPVPTPEPELDENEN